MTTHRIHPIVQHTAAVSRRTSLKTLGGVALAATSGGGPTAEAKKKGKRKKNKNKNKGNERCERQVGECQDIVTSYCADSPNPAACEAQFLPCCEPLADCQAGGFVECIDEVIPSNPVP